RLVIGGIFTNVNGFGLPRLFRTTSEGAIDASFTGSVPNGAVNAIAIAIDQKILIGGGFTLYGTVARKRSALLDQNGNLITGFDPSANPVNYVYAVAVQTDGKPFIGGQGDPSPAVNAPLVFRTNLDGTLDAGFDARIGFNGIGARLRVQPDAKILASGQFRNAYASDRFDIVRFNADGSLDVGFIPSTFIGIEASTILTGLDVQADGKILRAGTSSTGSGGTADRLQADGSFDFNIQNPNRPRDIRVLPNGQILYSTVNSLKRLNSNLTVDATFATTISGDVYRIALQSDGKILIGGSFTQVNGANRNGIARLNFDGTLDTTFNFFGGANGTVYDIAIQTDGKLIIAGEFTGVNFDTARKYIARLNSDGSLDTGYAPSVNAPVYALKFQPDGRLLIGGDMTLVNGVARTRFARLNANGSLEPSFNISTNDTVRSIELQADGKILYAGEFTKTNGQSTVGIGRLLNPAVPARTPFDFDGDGRADISVFRSSTNRWYELFSSDGTVAEETFGLSGDIVVPADFDGDGKTDEAIFRPSNGQWWYKSSIDGSQIANPFGQNGDIPRPSDFDGDGKADLVLFRPSTNTWFRFGSLTNQEAAPTVFGVTGDQPLVGDFDGDGKSDLAVFRPSNGDWWYAASSAGGAFRNVHWGQNGDIPVPADYDGDGRTDYAVYRPSEGGWYIYNSGNGSFTTIAFGISTDRPVAADYDGDGRADIAVFRPSTGIWYLLQSTSGFAGYQFGINTDTALPGALIP
ncbi:MAG: FG-GAP-like repeat-containing protein, partial [Acidobacteriota bacterium]